MPPVAPLTLTRAGDPPYGLIQSAREAIRGSYREAPTGGPEANLSTSADSQTELRWASGFTIDPEDCGGGTVADPCNNTDPDLDDDATDPTDIGPIQPVELVATSACSTFGTSPAEREGKATRKLRGSRSALLEAEFWDGTLAQASGFTGNQWLRKAGSTILNSADAMGVTTAFAELEQAIADGTTWGIGMIHAMPRTVTHWWQQGLLIQRGNILVSSLGTIVVPGRGYNGEGPEGQTTGPTTGGADLAWAYATTLVYVRLGPEEVLDPNPAATVDRTANTIRVRAWQAATANWDGCVHAAALVRHDTERTATGS